MRTKSAFVILVVPLTALFLEQAMTHSLGFSGRTSNVPEVPKTRSFQFTYEATVKNLSPSDARVRVWLPLAASDFNQSVTVMKVSSPAPTRTTKEAEYGNPMIYAEFRHPDSASATFSVDYKVTRREFSRGGSSELMRFNEESPRQTEAVGRFLSADRLVPIDGRMKELAEQNTQGKQGPVERLTRSTITCSTHCVTTSPAPAGAEVTPCGPAIPNTVTVQIFIRSSSP